MADEQDPKKQLEEEGLQRLVDCRIWKSLWDLDLRECYFFGTPQRQRTIQSYSPPPQQRLLDSAELNTDLAFELCGDFATEVINTYMPEAGQWCERGAGMYVTEDEFKKVSGAVRTADRQIFGAIRASNLYSEVSKSFDPDLAIGTVGMWIDPPRPGAAVQCLAVPIHEFEINLGPNGEIDDRFVVRWTRNRYVRRLVGEAVWNKIPEEMKKTFEAKPSERTDVKWGFWRLWEREDDEVWKHVLYVGKEMVHDAELVGEGSCPFLVFRWNPNPDWPWGHGPLIQGLPTLRQVDEFEVQRVEHAEIAIRPPLSYPDDSFAAIEQGLEPGMAYPIRPGSEGAIKPIYQPPNPEAANYQYEEKEHRLRKLFYVDFPQQSGDTPPTLGQWLDEMARAQRRIGRPGLPFWREGPAKIFLRFKYLLEKAGVIPPVQVDGRAIALMPYNPTQRAAEQQEIATAVQGLQLAAQLWPEEYKAVVDGTKSMKNLFDKMRIELIVFRDPEQVGQVLDRMQKLLGGQMPGSGLPAPQVAA